MNKMQRVRGFLSGFMDGLRDGLSGLRDVSIIALAVIAVTKALRE